MESHQQYIKKRILFALIMGMITTIIISFTLVTVNVGFQKNFLMIWLQSWGISYIIAVLAVLLIAPKVQSILDSYIK